MSKIFREIDIGDERISVLVGAGCSTLKGETAVELRFLGTTLPAFYLDDDEAANLIKAIEWARAEAGRPADD